MIQEVRPEKIYVRGVRMENVRAIIRTGGSNEHAASGPAVRSVFCCTSWKNLQQYLQILYKKTCNRPPVVVF